MKKTPLFLTIAFVVTIGGATLLYNYFANRENFKIWDIIPSQTVLVFEVGECTSCIDEIKKTPLWSFISQSLIRNPDRDSLFIKLLDHILEPKNKGYLSINLIQKDDFDFIFYLPERSSETINRELEKLKDTRIRLDKREFSGLQINEAVYNGKTFSWTTIEGVWIASYTPLLIEDVIRTYSSTEGETFVSHLGEAYQLPRTKNDAGNIYLNLHGVNNFLKIFLNKDHDLLAMGQSSLLDVKQRKNNLALNGFSILGGRQSGSLLSYFDNQSPVPFTIKQFISNRSIVVTSYGVSDGSKLFMSLDIARDTNAQDSLKSLSKIDFDALYSGLGREMALCSFESRAPLISRILIFNVSNPDVWLESFDRLSQATEKEDTLYFEQYSSYEIREIGIKKFPEKLFSPLVKGFEQTYYTTIGSTIFIAEEVGELRRFLDDIDREEVLGKSVAFNQFLESTLLESNFSIYVNTPRALGVLASLLNSKWKEVHSSLNRYQLSALGFSAYQFSHLNESFYTNITWSFESVTGLLDKQLRTPSKTITNIDHTIITGPFGVRNHTTKQEEYVVQDSLFSIHYFSADGKRSWKKEIPAKLIDGLGQVDYLNNNKLQLFFVANNQLHVIDRLGNYVNPFPVEIPAQQVEYVSIVDYDNSKRYRFLLAEKSGKLWLFDKEGKQLPGWKPLAVEGSLFTNANHHRIRGKDFIIAIRKDGWVYLKNRRGENIKGFPLNLEARPEGTYFLEVGNSLATTYFIVVSKDGAKIKFNVEGKIINREPLIKLAVDDQFGLIAEQNQKSFLIKRQNSRQLTILDEAGKMLFINEFIGLNSVDVAFYDFGSGRSFVVLTDLTQQLGYIYDLSGRLINQVPIETSGITLKSEGEKIMIISVHNQNLTISSLLN